MDKKYLPILALVLGFVCAFVTAQVHGLFFCLLPILAFFLGYFSSWRWGLLSGFLLFVGYTFATALMWYGASLNLLYPLQYFYAFITGGFIILLISALAPFVRRGIAKVGSIVVMVLVAVVVVWCGFQAWPTYSYYYQVVIHTSEDMTDLQLYLPAGFVSEGIYQELYDSPFSDPYAPLTANYDLEVITTDEHGQLLKFRIYELMPEGPEGYPYTANIIFSQPEIIRGRFLERLMPWRRPSAPRELIKLMPRYDVTSVNVLSGGESIGPVKVRESVVVEEFNTPIVVSSSTGAAFELRLENRTGQSGWINFAYSKSETYVELIRYEGVASGDWQLVPVEVTDIMRIRGTGD